MAGIGRRDVLKKAAVGGALVWSAPALSSVTAQAAAETPVECTTLTIPGLTFTCVDVDTGMTYFEIDDVNCAVVTVEEVTPGTTIVVTTSIGSVLRDLSVTAGGSTRALGVECAVPRPGPSLPFSLSTLAQSGATWNLDFSMGVNETSVFHSDITLTPA